MIPSGNGAYFLSGKTTDVNGDAHPFFLSVNENGEVLWENILNNVKGDADYAIKAPDGNYLAVLNYPGARLFKINGATGALMNSATIGGTEEYLANALAAIGNGRFVILGASNASGLLYRSTESAAKYITGNKYSFHVIMDLRSNSELLLPFIRT